MKKMYLMKGLAALAMVLVATSCHKDDFTGQAGVTPEEVLVNAELQLGVNIDPDQDWKMTKDVLADVSVNMGTGEDYTLIVYNKNPFIFDDAVYYARQTVSDGSKVSLTVSVPSSREVLYVTLLAANGKSWSATKLISDNSLSVDFSPVSAQAPSLMMRRANTGETYPSTSTGINANANEWADPNKEFGGWKVPDALTAGQKERVRKYFQANPDLDYNDPQWRHFFVQQVYKGGTAQAGVSNENIIAANNSVYTSDNMNLMTVGTGHQHINNFNAGNCSENDEVLSNGGNVNDGPYHTDQIMLMVNIDDTSCFGYHETGSSNHHDNKAALVSASVIDAWAAQNGNPGEAVTDEWNRSFLGFDLAIAEGNQAFEKNSAGEVQYADYSQAPESPQYAWDGEKVVQITTGEYQTITVGNEWSTWPATVPVYKDEYKTIMGCGWLTTNTNFYVADSKVTLSQTISINRGQLSALSGIQDCVVLKEVMDGDNWYQSVINLPRIKQLVDDGYLPVNNKSLTEWVKVGKSDGYFSDWIVTLTEAQRTPAVEEHEVIPAQNTPIYSYAFEDTEVGDYDMNDVVLKCQENGDYIDVWLVAAGATLDLEINLYKYDKTNKSGNYYGNFVKTLSYNNQTEIHRMWGVDAGVMVNTNAGGGANAKPIRLEQLPTSSYEVDKLRFTIKSSAWEVKLAGGGQSPYGIVIPMDWKWPKERIRITQAYSQKNASDKNHGHEDQSFETFASQKNKAEDWFNYPVSNIMSVDFGAE